MITAVILERKKNEIRKRTGDDTKGVVFSALCVSSCRKSNIRNGNPFIFVVKEKWLWLRFIVGVSLSILCYVLDFNMQSHSIRLSIPIPLFLWLFFFCHPFHKRFLGVAFVSIIWHQNEKKCSVINNAILMMRKGKNEQKKWCPNGMRNISYFLSFRPSNNSEQCKIRMMFEHRKQVFYLLFVLCK